MIKGHEFIGSYHPFPKEDPSSWRNKVDKRQLDLFKDYAPPKLSWWKRLVSKKSKKLLGIKSFF
jgi:hypothetical protein